MHSSLVYMYISELTVRQEELFGTKHVINTCPGLAVISTQNKTETLQLIKLGFCGHKGCCSWKGGMSMGFWPWFLLGTCLWGGMGVLTEWSYYWGKARSVPTTFAFAMATNEQFPTSDSVYFFFTFWVSESTRTLKERNVRSTRDRCYNCRESNQKYFKVKCEASCAFSTWEVLCPSVCASPNLRSFPSLSCVLRKKLLLPLSHSFVFCPHRWSSTASTDTSMFPTTVSWSSSRRSRRPVSGSSVTPFQVGKGKVFGVFDIHFTAQKVEVKQQ